MSDSTVLVGVGVDDDATLTRFADTISTLAGDAGLGVVLAHVYSEDDADTLEEMLDVRPNEEQDLSTAAEHNTAIRTLASKLDDAGVPVTIRGRMGRTSDELVSLASDLDADFLLIGGRRRTPAGKAIFGSTAQEVLLSAPCPVVFVKSD